MMHPTLPGLEPAYTPPEQPARAASRRYDFFVAGEPRPMGSKTAFAFMGKNGKPRAVVTDSPSKAPHLAGKLTGWKDSVIAATMAELGDNPQRIMGAVSVSLTFALARPAGHQGAKGIKPSAPAFPHVKPDLDKLARSTLDALAVMMLADDARVVTLTLAKRYADTGPTGAWITVEEIG